MARVTYNNNTSAAINYRLTQKKYGTQNLIYTVYRTYFICNVYRLKTRYINENCYLRNIFINFQIFPLKNLTMECAALIFWP